MAKSIEVTINITGTDTGETMFERQHQLTGEVGDVVSGTVRILAGASKRICIAGEENAAASPISLDLTQIRGFVLDLDGQVEMRFDAADAGSLVGPGQVSINKTILNGLTLVNDGAALVNAKYYVWGDQ